MFTSNSYTHFTSTRETRVDAFHELNLEKSDRSSYISYSVFLLLWFNVKSAEIREVFEIIYCVG